MSDALLVVDPNGHTIVTNRAYEELRAAGLDAAIWTDEDGAPLSPDAQPRQRAARGETFTLLCTIPEPQGLGRWLEAKGQPIERDGQLQGGVIVIRDISERSLRRLQDEFLALASHELRTPLTAARSALQLVMRNANGSADPQTIQRWAGIALRQVERLVQLVSDLMDVGRLQSGHLNLHMQPFSLGDVVTQAVEAARLLAPDQPIELSVPEQPLTVAGDPVRIEQIVSNLLNNAVKYAPQSPQIKVRLRRVGDHAELQVEDAGPGIAAEKLPRLFSRYYQADDGEQRSQSGLGLGLFLTKELVTAHGGTVDVVSRENVGTTFTITLPLGA